MITTSAPLFLDKTIFTIDFDVEYHNGKPYIIKNNNTSVAKGYKTTFEQSVDLSEFGIDYILSVDFVMVESWQTYPMSFEFDVKGKILKIGFFTISETNRMSSGKVRIKFYSTQHNRERRINLILDE